MILYALGNICDLILENHHFCTLVNFLLFFFASQVLKVCRTLGPTACFKTNMLDKVGLKSGEKIP